MAVCGGMAGCGGMAAPTWHADCMRVPRTQHTPLARAQPLPLSSGPQPQPSQPAQQHATTEALEDAVLDICKGSRVPLSNEERKDLLEMMRLLSPSALRGALLTAQEELAKAPPSGDRRWYAFAMPLPVAWRLLLALLACPLQTRTPHQPLAPTCEQVEELGR